MRNLVFHTYDGCTNVRSDQVMYIEADDHYSNVVYYSGHSFMLPFGLGAIENTIETLQDEDAGKFLRLGRRYIVNMEYVHQVNTVTQTITFLNAAGNKMTIRSPKNVLRDLIVRMSELY